jgi:hypothetical protein
MPVRPLFARLVLWTAVCGSSLAPCTTAQGATMPSGKKQVCAYSQNQTTMLPTFAALVGRATVDCGMVYVNSTDWAGWDSPWFLHYTDPNYNWATWVRKSPANDPRQFILNTTLIPSSVSSGDWRAQGAAGDFETYDRTLAQNLVNAGLSNAIIVLAAEANGNWEYDFIGSTPAQVANWVQTWRNTVTAMRSVPGAHFQFVWTINNRVPATPFASYYPGDDVVDIIGDDAYDMGVTDDANDWNEVSAGVDGVNALVAFAQSHGKPVAFPEWGVGVRNTSNLAGGDDPGYVNGLANVIAKNDVAFQSYFFNHEWQTQLQQGPLSLAAYGSAFGDGGWAVGSDDGENVTPTPTPTRSAPPTSVNGQIGTTTSATTTPAPAASPAPGATTTAAAATAPTAAPPSRTTTAKSPAKARPTSAKRRDARSRSASRRRSTRRSASHRRSTSRRRSASGRSDSAGRRR